LIGHGVFGCLVLARRAAQELPLVRKPPDLEAHPKTLRAKTKQPYASLLSPKIRDPRNTPKPRKQGITGARI
jgi:hypothetical protein